MGTRRVKVELVCQAEDELVAEIETDGPLYATTILGGLKRVDVQRLPDRKLIKDGVQLTCARCHQPLYFRGEDGALIAAMPGSARASS